MKPVAVVGDGAWGTAIATVLAHNGHQVRLWCHNDTVAQEIATKHENTRYLPGVHLSEHIIPTTNLSEALCGVKWVFEAVPVKFLRSVLSQAVQCYLPEQTWVVLSKGIEHETGLFPSQIIQDVLGNEVKVAVVAGPSFAHDLARKQLTAVTVGAPDCNVGRALQTVLANEYFRPYTSQDILGVQLGGALKNVLALGIGLLDGAGFTDNPQVLLFTQGLHEIAQLAQRMGAQPQTIYGFSGVGDMVLTAMGKLSRNKLVGQRLGHGDALTTILDDTGYIPEGINTLKSVRHLMMCYDLDMPVCMMIYHVVFEQLPLIEGMQRLMQRPLEDECPL